MGCAQTLEHMFPGPEHLTHKIGVDPNACAAPTKCSVKAAASVLLTRATVWPSQCLKSSCRRHPLSKAIPP